MAQAPTTPQPALAPVTVAIVARLRRLRTSITVWFLVDGFSRLLLWLVLLISAVQLSRMDDLQARGISPAMVDATIRQGVEAVEQVAVRDILRIDRFRVNLVLLAVMAFSLAGITAAVVPTVSRSSRHGWTASAGWSSPRRGFRSSAKSETTSP